MWMTWCVIFSIPVREAFFMFCVCLFVSPRVNRPIGKTRIGSHAILFRWFRQLSLIASEQCRVQSNAFIPLRPIGIGRWFISSRDFRMGHLFCMINNRSIFSHLINIDTRRKSTMRERKKPKKILIYNFGVRICGTKRAVPLAHKHRVQ